MAFESQLKKYQVLVYYGSSIDNEEVEAENEQKALHLAYVELDYTDYFKQNVIEKVEITLI